MKSAIISWTGSNNLEEHNEPLHNKTNKMTVHPVWSESSLSAFGSLATHWARSKESDQIRPGWSKSWWAHSFSPQTRQSLRCSHTWNMEVDEGSDQTSSPTGWLRMRVLRLSLRRTKSAIISWDGSIEFFRKHWIRGRSGIVQTRVMISIHQEVSVGRTLGKWKEVWYIVKFWKIRTPEKIAVIEIWTMWS